MYRFFIKENLREFDFSALKYCTVAGEPLNPEVYSQFLDMTGLKLREGYGQTEMTAAVAVFPWMEPKPGSMGLPSPGYDIDLLDDEGRSCEVGEKGQIVVRTDARMPVGMFKGYYKDPELTARSWHDGIYRTGDVAWKDEDGYFWFVGRTDDVIKSSGYRIGPFEVESALIEHPAVLECAVTGVPDADRGAVVKATVVLAKGYSASNELATELQEHVKKITAPVQVPAHRGVRHRASQDDQRKDPQGRDPGEGRGRVELRRIEHHALRPMRATETPARRWRWPAAPRPCRR